LKLNSRISSTFLPSPNQSSVVELGLKRSATSTWLAIDDDLPVFHAHKLQQIEAQRAEVIAALPESESAQREFCELLLDHLIEHHQHQYSVEGRYLSTRNGGLKWLLPATDLESSCLWIQEDICLLQPLNGEYVLTAASICSPSNWRLLEKIGEGLGAIHNPVPGYRSILHTKTNRLMHKLGSDKVISRYNWSVQLGNELCWRPDLDSFPEQTEPYWRVERQTLRRLSKSGAVVFGIRIFLESFAQLESRRPGFTTNIKEIIQRLPNKQKIYKGLDKTLSRL
tara:strand:+ start:2792 stop:3637 length:846 start_codon:yes stop_codon:yes gene_type:complete